MKADHDILTPAQAAKLKGVSRTAIYNALADGRLQGVRVLGRIGIARNVLKSWQPQARVGRPQGRYQFERRARGADFGTPKRNTRLAGCDSDGQWPGVHGTYLGRLGLQKLSEAVLHRTGQAGSECSHRKLQRQAEK